MHKTQTMLKKAICMAVIAAISLCIFCGCKKTITGNDWLMSQDSTMDNLEALVLGMDDVYTLYISGSITVTDFATELNVLKQEYVLVKTAYDQTNEANPIKPGTHSFASQKGYEAIEGLFASVNAVLTGSVGADTTPLPPNEVAYLYLAFRDTIDSYMADYIVAYSWVYNGAGYAEAATSGAASEETDSDAASDPATEPASINIP